jgi:mRNA-degrading endonuclease RelE of RelBE toxin-antitoxin system
VVAAIGRLAETGQGDVRRLIGAREWRPRVGDVRVLFRFDYEAEMITVRRILPRGRAYR